MKKKYIFPDFSRTHGGELRSCLWLRSHTHACTVISKEIKSIFITHQFFHLSRQNGSLTQVTERRS